MALAGITSVGNVLVLLTAAGCRLGEGFSLPVANRGSSKNLDSPRSVRLSAWLPGRAKERSDADLKEGIKGFYDASSKIWEDMWGEHMHHGYYEIGERPKSMEDHRLWPGRHEKQWIVLLAFPFSPARGKMSKRLFRTV
ncbi:unnamed protein product [Discosporangium mesarthrocarpum]